MNFSKDTHFRHRGSFVSDVAGIICAVTLVCALAACEQPSGNSTGAGVTVPVISITTEPQASFTVTEGSISGSLTVAASVTQSATLSYQWYLNTSNSNTGGTKINNATAAAFTIPTTLTTGTYYYFCEVSASGGARTVRSAVAEVTVKPKSTPGITITKQPESVIVTEGRITEILTITAIREDDRWLSPNYQWYSNTTNSNTGGSAIDYAKWAEFSIPRQLTAGTHYYYCEVSAAGIPDSVRSNVAVVTVHLSVEFVIQLTAITEANVIAQTAYVAANTDKTFTISGTGYTVQWYLNGVPVGTSQTYTFKQQDAGAYELAVVVTDTAGRKHSGSCRVTVR